MHNQSFNIIFLYLLINPFSCLSQETDDINKLITKFENTETVQTHDNDQLLPKFKVSRVTPLYPLEALSKGIEGKVFVEFTINIDGRTYDPVIINSEPKGVFEQAVIEAIMKWKFDPICNSKFQSIFKIRQNFSFKLDDSGNASPYYSYSKEEKDIFMDKGNIEQDKLEIKNGKIVKKSKSTCPQ